MDTLRDKMLPRGAVERARRPGRSGRVGRPHTDGDELRMKILITGNLGYVGPVRWCASCARRIPHAALIGARHRLLRPLPDGAARAPRSAGSTAVLRRHPAPAGRRCSSGVDAVVHLAAISNDPMGNRYEAVTLDVNTARASTWPEPAQGRGRRARSSSRRAAASTAPPAAARAARRHAVNPLTAYARSKVTPRRPRRRWPTRTSRRHVPALRNRLRHVSDACASTSC